MALMCNSSPLFHGCILLAFCIALGANEKTDSACMLQLHATPQLQAAPQPRRNVTAEASRVLQAPGKRDMLKRQQDHLKKVTAANRGGFYLTMAHSAKAPFDNGYLWLLGIPITLCGSTMRVAGLMVQKISQMESEDEDDDSETSKHRRMYYFLNWKWICGFALFLGGNAANWLALGMAPNSVLSVFSSWNIILTLLVAPKIFKAERVSRRTFGAAAVMVIGCCWVAIAGPRESHMPEAGLLGELFLHPSFLVVTACVVVFYISSVWKYLQVRQEADWGLVTVGRVSLAASACDSFATIFAKCSSTLFQDSLESHTMIQGVFFLYVILFGFWGIQQIHFLNVSLSHGAATFVIPFYESCSMGIQIAVGGMLFQEYADFTPKQHVIFWPGVCVVLGGVAALAQSADEDNRQTKGENLAAGEIWLPSAEDKPK